MKMLRNIALFLGSTSLVLLTVLILTSSSEKAQNESAAAGEELVTLPQYPDTLNFAGEKVPTSDFDVRERIDREFMVNTYWHSNTLLNLKRSYKYFPIIEAILKEEGVPDDFKYVAVAESGLANVTSPAGADGYWQFIESTGEKYGLEINRDIDERRNLEKATRAACAYIKDAKEKTGSWTLAAAAYNRGTTGVLKALEHQKVKDYYSLLLNSETSRYVPRIIAMKYIYSNPERYNFKVRKNEGYSWPETRDTVIKTTVADLVQFAKDAGTTYKTLKLLNPWLLDDHLPNASGKSYTIKLPK